jgi:hypothetical protein
VSIIFGSERAGGGDSPKMLVRMKAPDRLNLAAQKRFPIIARYGVSEGCVGCAGYSRTSCARSPHGAGFRKESAVESLLRRRGNKCLARVPVR